MRAGSAATDLLATYPAAVTEVALAARKRILAALPKAEERVDTSARVIGYGLGPGYRGLVFTIIPSRAGVKLGFVRGAELPDPRGLLQGRGRVHRHVPLKTPADLRQPGLGDLFAAALAAWRERSSPAVTKSRGR
jgi:hypothetical protein